MYRFHGYNSLRYVHQQGKTIRGQQITLKFAANQRREVFRCAIVVSRKVSKSAVVRNRIRRRIYEIIRTYQTQITEPTDLVFTILDVRILSMSPEQLTETITDLLLEARLIKKSKQSHSPGSHAMINTKES